MAGLSGSAIGREEEIREHCCVQSRDWRQPHLPDGSGPSALSRFDRDVLGQAGVRWVIVYEGVNDIGGTGTQTNPNQQNTVVDGWVQAFQQFVLKPIRTMFGVLRDDYSIPAVVLLHFIYGSEPSGDNRWIRTSGQCDAALDFDEAAEIYEDRGTRCSV